MTPPRSTGLTRDRQAINDLQPRVPGATSPARPSYEEWIKDRLQPIIDEFFAGRTEAWQYSMSDHQLEVFAADHGSVKINTSNGNIGMVLRRLYGSTHTVQIKPRGRRPRRQRLTTWLSRLQEDELRFPRVITVRPRST